MDETGRERLRILAQSAFRESIEVKRKLGEGDLHFLVEMAEAISSAFQRDRRLFLFGNGGSAADSQHLAAEFVNRFQMRRRPLPAMALTVDTSILTSIANDFDFEEVFMKQLQAYARAGDVALGISTSGSSPNVLKALRWARENGLQTIGWAGARTTEMDSYCDLILHVPSTVTARIQECHITVGHVLCALVEESLFGKME